MLTTSQSILFPLLAVIASLLFMAALNWVWPRENRYEHTDQIGWQLSVLGTTYAVILGFMLFAVWSSFGAAEENADFEANCLVNVYRLASGLPEPQRSRLQEQARHYADVVLQQDWPDMVAAKLPNASVYVEAEMWQTVMSVKSASATESTAEDHVITELSSLTEHRRTRLLQSESRLPTVLWLVLIVGGCLTVASACLFGSRNTLLHTLQVFAFSLLIALGLIAIADIHRPFQGSVHVSSYPFVRSQQNMQR